MKFLYVGDPHVQVSNLEESDSLLAMVRNVAVEKKPDAIVILGDLFNNFANVRTEVMDFWKGWLVMLAEVTKVWVLCGNHDMANSGDDSHKSNALSIFNLLKNPNLKIVDHPYAFNKFVFLPYFHDQELFIKKAHEMQNMLPAGPATVLICHQDLDGSQYENGFYAPNGADPERLNYNLIIGGHIHKRQRFGKVILPGTARWMTVSDANEPKGLWLVDHDENGAIASEEFIDTSHVCTPILTISWKEGEAEPSIPANARVSIELVGTSTWVTKTKAGLKGKASIKTKITDSKREERILTSQGILDYIMTNFSFLPGVKKEEVAEVVRSL